MLLSKLQYSIRLHMRPMVYALALNGCHQAASAHAETEPEVQFYLLFQKALCLFTTDAYIQCTEYRHSTLAYSKAGEPFCTIYSSRDTPAYWNWTFFFLNDQDILKPNHIPHWWLMDGSANEWFCILFCHKQSCRYRMSDSCVVHVGEAVRIISHTET